MPIRTPLRRTATDRPAPRRSLREAINAPDGRETLLFLAGLAAATALAGAADDARTWMDRADHTGNEANRLFGPRARTRRRPGALGRH
ncbi:hypothetical protein [Nonomuraea jabiensis]|uniref:hypothetical protein n=1 Tax=Nonomuraea jabiensis TaxID=882448 RepID=UPI00367BDBC2